MDHGPLLLLHIGKLKIRCVHESGMAPEETVMKEMANWCENQNCGRRTAYDLFQFKNKQEVLMFVLRWS